MTLPALGIAFLVLTATVVVGVVAADAALSGADRQALDRQVAAGVADHLVRDGAPVTRRANVLNATRLSKLSVADLHSQYGLPRDTAVRLTLDGRTLVTRGSPSEGATVERIVVVERRETHTLEPTFERSRSVTLPRRSPTATLGLQPPPNTTLRTVRANGRVRLHDPSGLTGSYELSLATVETVRFHFDATGPLSNDSVRIRYRPAITEKARLGVTVDG
jgi:hypothetical protein